MILNNACIINRELDGITYTDTAEYLSILLKTKLIADVYVATKKVLTCSAHLYDTNNWVICSVDGRFSVDKTQTYEHILIKVHAANSDTLFESSTTGLNGFLLDGDLDSDLNFCVGSLSASNSTKCFVPESQFNKLRANNMTPEAWDKLPTVNDSVTPIDPSKGGNVCSECGSTNNKDIQEFHDDKTDPSKVTSYIVTCADCGSSWRIDPDGKLLS